MACRSSSPTARTITGRGNAPEKLIPLTILKALEGERLPVYGTGANIRDWLHVDDHAAALQAVFERGRIGETYAIGAREEHSNIAVVARDLRPARRAHAAGAASVAA